MCIHKIFLLFRIIFQFFIVKFLIISAAVLYNEHQNLNQPYPLSARSKMETNSLRFFAEAAKDLNFTKTAKRLFISQQNLSNHIARLEQYYGVSLFDRKPHLALSYAGEVLLAYATNFNLEEDNLKNVLLDIKEKERGILRIGCSPTRTNIVIPHLIELFLKEYPNVQIQLYQLHTDEAGEKLLRGELDFSIGPDLERIHLPNLVTSPLFRDCLYLMVKKPLLQKYLQKDLSEVLEEAKNGIDIREYSGLPFVDVRTANIFKDVFKYAGCEPNFIITTRFLLHSQQNMYENIAASITTRTIYLHISQYMDPDVLFLPLKPIPGMPLHDIAFIRHRRKYLSRYGQQFMEITSAYFERLDREHPMTD